MVTETVEPLSAPAAVETPDQSVTFVLENASLEVGKVGKGYQLLNCDDHASFLKRHGKDPANYRPDICHQALLAILDSPLSKSGRLKALYIHTARNVLIQVHPQVRLPRTFKRFCGLMVQLLQKLSIRATNGPDKLLKVIKGPITKHLTVGAARIGLSRSAEETVKLPEFYSSISFEPTAVFVVGAMAHGHLDITYVDRWVSISNYPLSAACCIGRLTNALEMKWDIV
ncbi:hypothetical protein WJX73_007869 [Symbiochloris irregularis]|uniref:Ribosomal RNA small subunit methyltransferase NEP1 n=1 Tax=Symbiochloris irregularis TaxID=706552 RepID=A0AAW1NTB8_9CHLO